MSSDNHREQLLAMAATWDALAEDRSALARRHPEVASGNEREDERQDRDIPSS